MTESGAYDLGTRTLLEFRGPDATRFVNGQITQDVRKVEGRKISLPSCVTDAKGRLQFRIMITEGPAGSLWIEGPEDRAEELEARLTRYLIADEVEVSDLTGNYRLIHLLDPLPKTPRDVISRSSNRYGVGGTDWWMPCCSSQSLTLPTGTVHLGDAKLESLRIINGIPAWGSELVEGMLPPEAALEDTDISYNKGCYIGQEVISRIKSAGKVNKRLTRFIFDAEISILPGPLENAAGEITSISPLASGRVRHALGYVKRGATELICRTAAGKLASVTIC